MSLTAEPPPSPRSKDAVHGSEFLRPQNRWTGPKPAASPIAELNLGRRLRELRVGRGMTQAALASVLGLKDRQSVAYIEGGQRRLTIDELIKVIGHFGISFDELTSPIHSFERSRFSWRQHNASSEHLQLIEQVTERWIGAYREISSAFGSLRQLQIYLDVSLHGSEEALATGQKVSAELQLDDAPALRLADALEQTLGIDVFLIDPGPDIHSAACRLSDLKAILLNRALPATLRHVYLAQEFFHLLTWDRIEPPRVKASAPGPGSDEAATEEGRPHRAEHLAESFALGLLLPDASLPAPPRPGEDTAAWLHAAAADLGVPSSLLRRRLTALKYFGPDDLAAEPCGVAPNSDEPQGPLFSRRLVSLFSLALDQRYTTLEDISEVLRIQPDQFRQLRADWGIR
jgi:transcriptional regulator with XRE-family HTH domain